ncbi:uncharacterized protein F5147DRAFT_590110, partial [Suillus discolor]
KISPDVKLATIRLYKQGILHLREILECVGFSRHTFFHIQKLYECTGNVVKPRSAFTGHPRNLNLEDMAQYMPDELCFIDETSVDEHTSFWRYGHAKKSRCASMRALSIDGVIAGHVIEGSLCWKGYLHLLEHSFPQCEAYLSKHSVLVMDNTRIHHGAEICELAERFGKCHCCV